MASRSGPGQAVYDSMTLIQQRNDPAKNDESNASLTAKSCPLTHTSPCTTEGSLTKRCLDLRLPPWSAKCWSVCDHDMKLQKWTTMWASLWPSTPFSSIHSIHATHCNTNDYCSWPLHFAAVLILRCLLRSLHPIRHCHPCASSRVNDSWITFHNLSSHEKARAGKHPQWSPDIFQILSIFFLVLTSCSYAKWELIMLMILMI